MRNDYSASFEITAVSERLHYFSKKTSLQPNDNEDDNEDK
jgi:hypothetical protein